MVGDVLAAMVVVFLALYGCAQLIRRVCLWLTRCPRCTWCCRVAVPRSRAALEPLFRCLESQAVWADPDCRRTLVLLPEDAVGAPELTALMGEHPSVIPVTAPQLHAMLLQLAEAEKDD